MKVTLKSHGNPTNHSFVLVCRRCGEAFCSPDDPDSQNPSVQLKRWLEEKLLQAGTPYLVRVTNSGCQDVCPGTAITVRVVNTPNPEESVRTYTFEPSGNREELLAEVQKHLRKRPE